MKNNKEYNYFKAFVDSSNFSLQAAELLSTTVHKFDKANIEAITGEMHNIEHTADLAKHEVMNRLVKEFLPPIEREDIISLCDKIDDVTDAIEDVLIGIDIFNVQTIRPELLEFTQLIMNCCKSMHLALMEFENFKKSKTLHSLVVELNRLEEDGDKLYIDGVRNLYRSTKDPIELMVWTEIYRRLEKCCDNCEDVANDIENVVMKNS